MMSIPEVQGNSLPSAILHNPSDQARICARKAFLFNVIEKVSWVALLAIMGVVLFASFSSTMLTGMMPLVLLGAVISTAPLSMLLPKIHLKATNYYKQAQFERDVAAELEKIEGWTEDNVKGFLTAKGLNPDQIPTEKLRTIRSDSPLCALLPLIARFQFMEKRATKIYEDVKKTFKPRERQAPSNSLEDRSLVLNQRRIAWHQIEFEAYPRLLQSALYLAMMQNPTLGDLTPDKVGTYHAKEVTERQLDTALDNHTDYFTITDGRKITLSVHKFLNTEKPDPADIHQQLFPTSS